jgi:hypothetical protein
MEGEKIRAWWAHKQGLDGSLAGMLPALVLERTGWARSVGGAGPYLTLWGRASVSREAADSAVAALDIHELPAARGCTYVVPSADFALALKSGRASGMRLRRRQPESWGLPTARLTASAGQLWMRS